MYSSLPAVNIVTDTESGTEIDTPPILIELTKKAHFCRFLEKEMNTAKTEAEKEAVQAILVNTQVEIRAMEKKWKRSQAALQQSSRPVSKKVANGYPTQRIQ